MRTHAAGVLHDKGLCLSAQAGTASAQEQVFAGSEGLVRSRIGHVIGMGRWPANVSLADAEQEARLALFRALLSWDGRRPLTTLAVTCIDRQLRRWRAQTFPTLHMSRAAYAASHGHVPIPTSLDAPGDGAGRSVGETLSDPSAGGGDPLVILERVETVRERSAAITAARGRAGTPLPPPASRQSRTHGRPRLRVVEVHHGRSSWSSLRLAFAAECGKNRRPVPQKGVAAVLPGPTARWRQLRLDLGTDAA